MGWTVNQLEVIDISIINQPELIKVHPMEEPLGLAVENKRVFVCHGDQGLGIYNLANPNNLVVLKKLPNLKSYDIILNNSVMLVTGPGGIYQYDYSDLNSLVLLSTIPVP